MKAMEKDRARRYETAFGLAAAVPQGVVYVRLPLAQLTGGFDGVAMPAGGYLALRQGAFSVREQSEDLKPGELVMLRQGWGLAMLLCAMTATAAVEGPGRNQFIRAAPAHA